MGSKQHAALLGFAVRHRPVVKAGNHRVGFDVEPAVFVVNAVPAGIVGVAEGIGCSAAGHVERAADRGHLVRGFESRTIGKEADFVVAFFLDEAVGVEYEPNGTVGGGYAPFDNVNGHGFQVAIARITEDAALGKEIEFSVEDADIGDGVAGAVVEVTPYPGAVAFYDLVNIADELVFPRCHVSALDT